MKQFLLIAAIYSLIIHQSQKQAKQKMPPAVKKPMAKTTISVMPRQQLVPLNNLSYENSGFIGIIPNAHAKLSLME
jgi:hypothetical protein